LHDYCYRVNDFRGEVAQALGKRATLRLREGDGGFRDIVAANSSPSTQTILP
jgi:cysteinyl-tRNA synthetase